MSVEDEGFHSAELRLGNRLDELERLHDFFDEVSEKTGWPGKMKWNLALACEELVTNTISYGYPNGGEHAIVLSVYASMERVAITLYDEGIPFNPLDREDPDTGLELDEREIGGLGIFFVKQLMDEVSYERTEKGNRLLMLKLLTP